MGFYATDFIYDGISSNSFGVKMISNSSSRSGESGGIAIDYTMESTEQSAEKEIVNWKHNGVISFPVTVAKEEGFDRREISKIINWLTGKTSFKQLQIIQQDMTGISYYCVFNNPKIQGSGNVPYSITFDVVCNAPWAYESIRKQKYTITTNPMKILFNNTSDDEGLLMPISVTIKARGNGDIKIVNKTNNNEEVLIKSATTGEVITMIEKRGKITSSKGINMLERCNKEFLRFVPKVNEIEVTNVSELTVEYQFIRKIGG